MLLNIESRKSPNLALERKKCKLFHDFCLKTVAKLCNEPQTNKFVKLIFHHTNH